MRNIFQDRIEAGRLLAEKLARYTNQPGVIVLGLPRGGVPVAFEVAKALRAPLDVFVVSKLGTPGRGELAMGAIATGGIRVLNHLRKTRRRSFFGFEYLVPRHRSSCSRR
jgi:putative phosphoribosyl transferase